MRRLLFALVALLLLQVLLPAVALATEIPPGYRVSATRLEDGQLFLGHLADARDGRAWLWVTEAPYVTLGPRADVFHAFDVEVQRVTLADGTMAEHWTIPGGDHFSGLRVREENPTGSTEWGTGAGVIGGFAVQAYAR